VAIGALNGATVDDRVIGITSELQEGLHKGTAKISVPSVWVKGSCVGGCNDGPEPGCGMLPMLASGKLQAMPA